MTLRKYDPALKAEITDLLDAGRKFREQRAERERQREETRRRCDAAILSSDPLPPPPDDAA